MNSAATVAFGWPTSFGLEIMAEAMPAIDSGEDKPKEKLPVQIANVDSVHVDYMDVLEPGQGQVGQDLTTKTTRTNDKNFGLISQEILHLEMDTLV